MIKKLILCLLMSSLSTTTLNAGDDTFVLLTSKKDVVIKSGQKAGFNGILVPEYNYRDYSKAMINQPLCEEALADVGKPNYDWVDFVMFFGGGAVIGFVMSRAAK